MTEEKLLREKFGIVELSLIDAHTATLHKILPPKEWRHYTTLSRRKANPIDRPSSYLSITAYFSGIQTFSCEPHMKFQFNFVFLTSHNPIGLQGLLRG
jgi:hypothetical protein